MRKFVKRFDVPEDVARGADGPAWVEFRTRFKGKYIRNLNRAATLAAQVTALDYKALAHADLDEQARAIQLAEQSLVSLDAVYDVYNAIVVDWNWLDFETGEPLPKPDNIEVFQEELDNVQIGWIRQQIHELAQYRATEGNVRRPASLNGGPEENQSTVPSGSDTST